MAERYAVINKETKEVEKVVMWDGQQDYKYADSHEMVPAGHTYVGDRYHSDTKQFERTEKSR